MDRRKFMKDAALASACASAVAMVPGVSFGTVQEAGIAGSGLDWHKTPCRFCGVGCGLLVGVSDGKAVAVKGDPASSVSRGLGCVKGLHAVQVLYAADRFKQAYVKRDGKMVPVPISEALDLVASKMQETIDKHGKDSVALYGSGQWTIPDGYVASKFMKGCIGTNNLEANARLCMASAVTGFLTTFGADEPMGCYDDIEKTETFVMWGNNMAEMHPVLFSRCLEQRRRNPGRVKIIDLSTRATRTSRAADYTSNFRPQTDLAIANAICHEIIKNNQVDWDFVNQHVNFKEGKTNIGYGLEDHFKVTEETRAIDVEAYTAFLEDYTPEKVEKLSGVSAYDIRRLAAFYGDPNRKVISFWCMGMNQHTRGTWINNLVYNIHLLTGKISKPGDSPFSLTGQPSACGTVREVGTLTHKLPHGVVMNKEHREFAAKIWDVPVERIPAKPTYHTVEMFRAIDRGEIRFLWTQVTNPMQTMPKLGRYTPACEKDDRFIVVSDIYPTPTTAVADVILPAACWIEREGMYGNSERRTQQFDQLVEPPGEAMCDTWQIIEVARRMGFTKEFPYPRETYIKDIYEEYCLHQAGMKHGMAPYDELRKYPGLQWPYVNGKETKWRYNEKYDPAVKKGSGFEFYGKKDGKAVIYARPYEPAPEEPDTDYPFWLCTGRVIEHWHTGSMTRRIPVLNKSVPEAYVEINPEDARRMGIVDGHEVRLTSRRGTMLLKAKINGRGNPPSMSVFVPFFDENKLINHLTLDAFDPYSKQPDYKKCAIKVERA
ncbi:MAG: molybdopterin-dependent oxidoreductase [Pontiella sp.]